MEELVIRVITHDEAEQLFRSRDSAAVRHVAYQAAIESALVSPVFVEAPDREKRKNMARTLRRLVRERGVQVDVFRTPDKGGGVVLKAGAR